MQIHELEQGSNAWQQFRLDHFGASEASAMLGLSKKVTRNELLRMKKTGIAREFSNWVQTHILDHGHEVEALARPIVEGIIKDDLYPVACSEGKLSASCDGLTMAEDTAFEHKQWNKDLAAHVAEGILPEEYMPQCQQVLMVTGAGKLIFVVSDGTPDNMVWMWVLPDQEWFGRLRAGWVQFERDLAEYVPTQVQEKPQADHIEALPALSIVISGDVKSSNLEKFKVAAKSYIANIKTELVTDEDFANAEATAKFCGNAEKTIELAKASILAQTESIEDIMRTLDDVKESMRATRLKLEKLVINKKEAIKADIVTEGKAKYAAHIQALQDGIKGVKLVCIHPDFTAAIKNKRTVESLQNAVDTALAGAKVEADEIAEDLRTKLAWLDKNASEHMFLLRDLQDIIYRGELEYLQLLVKSRVDEHAKIEAKKLEDAKRAAEFVAVPVVSGAEIVRRHLSKNSTTTDSKTEPPTLKMGGICARLGFTVTAEFLRSLGVEPASRTHSAVLYHESDFAEICTRLIAHIEHVQNPVQQAA